MCDIKNLEELILQRSGDKQCVSASTTKLTAAGDNYSSIVLAVDVTVSDGSNQELLHLVAKLLPKNEFIQKLFRSKHTQRNEIGFYQTIIPCLREFQREQGFSEILNTTPEFYNARLSLDPSADRADEDSVLLIRNVKEDGFVMLNRRIGFNLDQCQFILEKMAQVHATVIALKLLKPDVFKNKLEPFFQEYKIYETDNDDEKQSELIDSLTKYLVDDAFCVENLDKVVEILKSNLRYSKAKNHPDWRESQFATLVHIDVWINNIMLKIVDGKTVDLRFLDYQIYEYSSAARDVVFFLFSSVQIPVLQQNVDALLSRYYNNFIKYLKKLNCDESSFTFDAFLEEVKTVTSRVELFHLMIMMMPLYAEDADDVDHLDLDSFVHGKVAPAANERACFIVREFCQRGWI